MAEYGFLLKLFPKIKYCFSNNGYRGFTLFHFMFLRYFFAVDTRCTLVDGKHILHGP